jgi:ParB-like chromosome segregation protein Spo0J
MAADPGVCSGTSKSPFHQGDVVNIKYEPPGMAIDFSRTSKLSLNVKASVDADIQKLAGLEASQVGKARATLTAAYAKANQEEYTLTGTYSEWSLSDDAMERLRAGEEELADCKKRLVNTDYRIVTAIGLVHFDVKFADKSLDDLATQLDAELSKNGIDASLAVEFKKKVQESLKAQGKLYQVVVWKRAKLEPVPSLPGAFAFTGG